MEDRYLNTVGNVEPGTADAVGMDAVVAHRRGVPIHVVEKQGGRDVCHLACVLVDMQPCQHAGFNGVGVLIGQLSRKAEGVVGRHLNVVARGTNRVVGHGFHDHRVQKSSTNRDVQSDRVRCSVFQVVVHGREGVRLIACIVWGESGDL